MQIMKINEALTYYFKIASSLLLSNTPQISGEHFVNHKSDGL